MRILGQTSLRRGVWICQRCRALSTISKRDVPERRQSQKLPATPARTRFAPSPTGYLHLGSLRTALFNYLTAKATGGQFILRLEDTDRKRTVQDAESRLYRDLGWTGLQWDEGPDIGGSYGPYKQSERTSLYQRHAEILLGSGHAYRCFCSAERLDNLAKERNKLGLPSDYDRVCATIGSEESDERASKKESYVIRLKVPDVPPHFTDLVYGVVGRRKKAEKLPSQQPHPSYEDPVLLKSDGSPTYHLANVVDDHHMEITHVIRAAEWMSSTPKHIMMYKAFDWEAPTFAHVGLLQDSLRQKFSKRDSSLTIRSFEEEGIFAEALLNYVALFGWSHQLEDDFLRLNDLVKHFDLKFTKGNTIATPNKLTHLQKRHAQQYVRESGEEYESMIDGVVKLVRGHLEAHSQTRLYANDELRERASALLQVDAANYTAPKEFFDRNRHFFCIEQQAKYTSREDDQNLRDCIEEMENRFKAVPVESWNEQQLKQTFDSLVADLSEQWSANVNHDTDVMKQCRNALQRFLRWALTGGRPGPTVILTLSLLGREIAISRIESATAEFKSVTFNSQKQI